MDFSILEKYVILKKEKGIYSDSIKYDYLIQFVNALLKKTDLISKKMYQTETNYILKLNVLNEVRKILLEILTTIDALNNNIEVPRLSYVELPENELEKLETQKRKFRLKKMSERYEKMFKTNKKRKPKIYTHSQREKLEINEKEKEIKEWLEQFKEVDNFTDLATENLELSKDRFNEKERLKDRQTRIDKNKELNNRLRKGKLEDNMVRKLKREKEKYETVKIRAKSDEEIDKQLEFSYLIISFSKLVPIFCKRFRIDDKTLRADKDLSLEHFENSLFSRKNGYGELIVLFKKFYTLIRSFRKLDQDKKIESIEITKNLRLNKAFNHLENKYTSFFSDYLVKYVLDIKDDYLKFNYNFLIIFRAILEIISGCLVVLKNKDMLHFFDKKDVLVIRLLTPQIKEMLTKILIEYTSLNEEEKEKIKADLETRLAYLHAESLNVEIIK